ncbi:hypothetical protein, partial [Pseudoalteromonas sp. SR41-8]|uniref:hypothetical protein n=1 Tax=Pseudoalteromonas sp. SR41-8 TaxID=2760946 RepID=UPI001C71A0C8
YFFYILIIVFVCDKHFLYFFGLRIFLVISGALSIYGLMQYVYFMFSGIALPWYLPFLEIKYGNELIENSSYYFSEFGYRFSSLFSEPAHFSQYIGLALLLLVLQEKVIFSKRFDSSLMFLLAISLLLSASGTGFALLILVFIAFTKVRILQNKSILGLLFFIYISIPAIAFVLLNFSTGFERMTSFSDVSSIYIRVIRPYSVYFDMPVLQMIFGVGYGNYSEYVLSLNTLTAFELERNITWANSGAFLLVGVGGFALLPYLYFHYSISRKCIISMFTTLFIVLHLIYSDLPLSIFYILSIAFVLSVGKSGESFHKD